MNDVAFASEFKTISARTVGEFLELDRYKALAPAARGPFVAPSAGVEANKDETKVIERNVRASATLPERIFDARVEIKVATSYYAMHLSNESRARLFSEFDYVLDEEAWDEEDKLPAIESYRRFLKWSIFTGDSTWSSLGIDDDGNILVAWVRGKTTLTANFGERIRWTHKIDAAGDIQLSSGNFTLEHFARQAKALLLDFE